VCLESGTAYAENKTKGIKMTDSKAELSACCNAPLFPHLDEAESHSWEDVSNAPLVCEICGEYQNKQKAILTGAVLETRNFTFWAFGESKSECRRMLADRWKLHQKQTNATFEFAELEDSVFYFGITKGAFRDGELPEGN
jgi:hypothetical protein